MSDEEKPEGKPRSRRRNPERDADIWRRWCNFENMREIGKRYNISHQRVHEIINTFRAEFPEINKAAMVVREVEFLEKVRAEQLRIAAKPPAPATADGAILRDPRRTPDGDPESNDAIVDDYSGQLAALGSAVQASAALRRLLGMDSPVRVDSTQTIRYTIDGVDMDGLK